jgi:hypothetical protein
MAMGIPVICNVGVGDTDTIVTENKSGVLVKSFEQNAYKKAIADLKASSFDPGEIRAGAARVFSLSTGVESYAGVYQKIFSK